MLKSAFKRPMELYNKLYRKHSELTKFFTYVFCGGIATIVDFSILYLLTEFAGLWYMFSATISYFFGMLTNYSLNKFITFRNKSRKIARQFGLFAVVSGIGLLLNLAIMYCMVEWFHVWYMLAKVVSTFLVFVWSYTGHKRITFGFLK